MEEDIRKEEIQRLLTKEKRDKEYRKNYYKRNKEKIKQYHQERNALVSELLGKEKSVKRRTSGAPDFVVIGFTKSEVHTLFLHLDTFIEEHPDCSDYIKDSKDKFNEAINNPDSFPTDDPEDSGRKEEHESSVDLGNIP